jgi:hypothetical protein
MKIDGRSNLSEVVYGMVRKSVSKKRGGIMSNTFTSNA